MNKWQGEQSSQSSVVRESQENKLAGSATPELPVVSWQLAGKHRNASGKAVFSWQSSVVSESQEDKLAGGADSSVDSLQFSVAADY